MACAFHLQLVKGRAHGHDEPMHGDVAISCGTIDG